MKAKSTLFAFLLCAVLLQGCAADRSSETQSADKVPAAKQETRPDGTAAPQNFNDAIKSNPDIPDNAKKAMLGQGATGN